MDAETRRSLIEIVKSCELLQLCTFGLNNYPETRTVMNGLNRDIDGFTLHFLTLKSSRKIQQISTNPNCSLYYLNPETRRAIRLFGIVSIGPMKDEYWKDEFKKYGYLGVNDERVVVLTFVAKEYKFSKGGQDFVGTV